VFIRLLALLVRVSASAPPCRPRPHARRLPRFLLCGAAPLIGHRFWE